MGVHADWDYFQHILNNGGLDIETDDIDDFFDNFTSGVLAAANKSIPRRRVAKKSNSAGNVWWNTDCEEAI